MRPVPSVRRPCVKTRIAFYFVRTEGARHYNLAQGIAGGTGSWCKEKNIRENKIKGPVFKVPKGVVPPRMSPTGWQVLGVESPEIIHLLTEKLIELLMVESPKSKQRAVH